MKALINRLVREAHYSANLARQQTMPSLFLASLVISSYWQLEHLGQLMASFGTIYRSGIYVLGAW